MYVVVHKNIANPSYMCIHLQYSQQEKKHNLLHNCIYTLTILTITAHMLT
jgi:hypothetical protein